MTIMVECKCGRRVEMDFTKTFINMPHSGYDILIGEQKCPNPDCDRTIYVNGNITVAHTGEKNWLDSKVDWEEAKIGDIVYLNRCPYEIALKSIRNISSITSINVIHLRSKSGDYNLVGAVTDNGTVFMISGRDKTVSPAGYETWEEKKINGILSNFNFKEGL